MGNPVQEVQRPIEGVDNKPVCLVAALENALFFQHKPIARACFGELFVDDVLSLMVGVRDKVPRPFSGDLKVFHLAEIAKKTAPGTASGFHHDGDQGRLLGHVCVS